MFLFFLLVWVKKAFSNGNKPSYDSSSDNDLSDYSNDSVDGNNEIVFETRLYVIVDPEKEITHETDDEEIHD